LKEKSHEKIQIVNEEIRQWKGTSVSSSCSPLVRQIQWIKSYFILIIDFFHSLTWWFSNLYHQPLLVSWTADPLR
jgi:hypothetical protein